MNQLGQASRRRASGSPPAGAWLSRPARQPRDRGRRRAGDPGRPRQASGAVDIADRDDAATHARWRKVVAGIRKNLAAGKPIAPGDPRVSVRKLEPGEAGRARRDGHRHWRKRTKEALLIAMLRGPEGATIAQVIEATGWQPHTIQGAISAALKKERGLEVISTKTENGRSGLPDRGRLSVTLQPDQVPPAQRRRRRIPGNNPDLRVPSQFEALGSVRRRRGTTIAAQRPGDARLGAKEKGRLGRPFVSRTQDQRAIGTSAADRPPGSRR